MTSTPPRIARTLFRKSMHPFSKKHVCFSGESEYLYGVNQTIEHYVKSATHIFSDICTALCYGRGVGLREGFSLLDRKHLFTGKQLKVDKDY